MELLSISIQLAVLGWAASGGCWKWNPRWVGSAVAMRSPWFQPLRARLDCMLLMVERHPKNLWLFWPKKWWGIWINWLINLSTFSDHHIIPRIREYVGFPVWVILWQVAIQLDEVQGFVGIGIYIPWGFSSWISHIYHTFPIQESFECDLRITLVKNFTSRWGSSPCSTAQLLRAAAAWGGVFSPGNKWLVDSNWMVFSTSKSDESDGFLLIPEIEQSHHGIPEYWIIPPKNRNPSEMFWIYSYLFILASI